MRLVGVLAQALRCRLGELREGLVAIPRGAAELLDRRHLEPIVRGRDRVSGFLGSFELDRILGGLVLLGRVRLELDRLKFQFLVRIVPLSLTLGVVLFLGFARGGFERRVDPGGLEHVVELKLARRHDVVEFVVVIFAGSRSLGALSIVLLAHEGEHEIGGVVVDVVVRGARGFSAPDLPQRAARLDVANAPRIFVVGVVVERRGGLGAVAVTATGRAALALPSMGRAEVDEGRRGVTRGLGRDATEVSESDRRASVGGREHAAHHERAAEGEAHENTAPDAPRLALARADV